MAAASCMPLEDMLDATRFLILYESLANVQSIFALWPNVEPQQCLMWSTPAS